jgi:ribosomal protein L24
LAKDSIFKAGDRVKVKSGKEHDPMTKGKTGTIREVSTPALGIKFDGMDKVHKWHVDEEIEKAADSEFQRQMAKVANPTVGVGSGSESSQDEINAEVEKILKAGQ